MSLRLGLSLEEREGSLMNEVLQGKLKVVREMNGIESSIDVLKTSELTMNGLAIEDSTIDIDDLTIDDLMNDDLTLNLKDRILTR